ncbi:hypothetical protein [Deinococcus peraridilitoris]|uniref:Phage integrase family protein n=1 Tax=Deinococcus peraridilitoris (strain DSM 19664 / LMG 22246 / CIP 109416 / KR-200) TaxID=937777 RepID=L0A028_DEIPD|nr:hypothetical protein [Deinococcus peraridilitoris]AFZ67186.1 hypothetical protein Deipe_1653 [Deinococcus peraridilitoris DSM 19664]
MTQVSAQQSLFDHLETAPNETPIAPSTNTDSVNPGGSIASTLTPQDPSRSQISEHTTRQARKAEVQARLVAAGAMAAPLKAGQKAQDVSSARTREMTLQLIGTRDLTQLTLLDGLNIFLASPHDKDASKTNADRTASDLGNHRRACFDAALGFKGTEDLSRVSLSFLARDFEEIGHDLERGMRRRLGLSEDQVLSRPDRKRLSNLRSDLKRVHSSLSTLLNLPGVAPKAALQMRQVEKGRWQKGLRAEEWPRGLWAEFEGLRSAFTDSNYAGPGHRYFRKHRWRPVSCENTRTRLNRVVDFLVNEEKLQHLTLHDLLDFDRFLRFRAWYFERVTKGGYAQFRATCSALANVARYLKAIDQLDTKFDVTSKHPDAPWSVFVAEGKATLAEGKSKQQYVEAESIPLRTPLELAELAKRCKTMTPRTTDGRRPSSRQLFQRKFSAVFFGLGIYMPVRGRNWREMRWGKNLKRDEHGGWHVQFVGDELKNGSYSRGIREYKLQLPEQAGEWIEWWREQLRLFVGDDFERTTPLVFPMLSTLKDEQGAYLWTPMSHKYCLDCVDDAALEGMEQRFRPHLIRHCVATFIVASGHVKDVQQAATLLGDTIETVWRKYFKPDEQKLLDEGYYAKLKSCI